LELVYSVSQYSSLPSKAGVYKFLDGNGNVIYAGKANDLKSRVCSYFINKTTLGEKTRVLVENIRKINITIVESELEALLLEAFYIKKYKPKYNIRLADNKSYISIKITSKDVYPNITLVRQEKDPRAIYFGPYPNTSSVKLVLKTIRQVFPYVSVRNHPKKPCLYHHLGLCPCPGIYDSKQASIIYKQNIRSIIRILKGQSRKIMKELEIERETLSKNELFEEALIIQKKIDALSFITTPFHRPLEYDLNPNLRMDIREKEMQELIQTLNKYGMNLESLSRIECYDISNLQGTNATGSMVVFLGGEKEGSQYRRFKIRGGKPASVLKGQDYGEAKPNDFAMMSEVLKRRFKHTEWDAPNLIIVDGGKGQVSCALEVLKDNAVSIPLIGLAKREETIVIPITPPNLPLSGEEQGFLPQIRGSQREFEEVLLPRNSPSLNLIMRIRDEAHRFAINYHKNLRSKSAIFC